MTIHAAKGLEFSHVFIVGAEEGLFPAQSALDNQEEMEEERRLMYVALTRAQNRCTITHTQNRWRFGKIEFCTPSRFISELSETQSHKSYSSEPFKAKRSFKPEGLFQSSSNQKSVSLFKPSGNLKPVSALKPSNEPSYGCEIKVGSKVKSERFGLGVVLAVAGSGNEQNVSVQFVQCGVRFLLTRFSKLTIVD